MPHLKLDILAAITDSRDERHVLAALPTGGTVTLLHCSIYEKWPLPSQVEVTSKEGSGKVKNWVNKRQTLKYSIRGKTKTISDQISRKP